MALLNKSDFGRAYMQRVGLSGDMNAFRYTCFRHFFSAHHGHSLHNLPIIPQRQ